MSFSIVPDAFDVGNMLSFGNNRQIKKDQSSPGGTRALEDNFEKPNRKRYQLIRAAVNTTECKECTYMEWRE